jgi:tetratricopeptide (TPR) repeat protein
MFLPLLLALFVTRVNAQSDTAAFRSAMAVRQTQERISALRQFVAQFPQSMLRAGGYNALFALYVDQGDESRALDAATHYLGLVPPGARMNTYNQFAYALAGKNIGLDSALVYAELAESMARGGGSGTLGPILDTHAFVLFRKGDAAAAEKLQEEAMRGHEDDPEYLGHLALYQEKNGKRRQALSTASRAVYLGGDREMKSRFLEWLALEEKGEKSREALMQSIVLQTVHSSIDTLSGPAAVAAKSNAAAFMARFSVDLPAAQKYAEAAAQSLSKDSPVEDAVTFRQNLALVTAARGNLREALEMLRSIEDFASPWSTDFWTALGEIYRRLGDPGKAIAAYMNGLTVLNPKELRDSLESVYKTVHGSTAGLDADLERVKESGAEFDPGRYSPGGPGSGKAILAELFTGAECGPCVAADMAFDALGEYFPRTDLLMLEYHVHIPGPDPLTTDDSWSRYQMYRAGGTPTAVIDGREKIVGGGPRFIAHNRFNLYRYAIQKYVGEAPGMSLAIDVARLHESITVTARVGKGGAGGNASGCVLHVALVQRSVDYTGANGISRHAMVVRKLFGGPGGTSLTNPAADQTLRTSLDLAEVDAGIRDLLRDPKGRSSWPGPKRLFNGWRPHPESVDRTNLTVVAWIQDPATNAVLQSAYQDVPAGMRAD